jgi:hypothetical protein
LEPFGLERTVIAWPWSVGAWSHRPRSHSRGRNHAGPLEPFGATRPRTKGAARSWSHSTNGSSASRGTARGGGGLSTRGPPPPPEGGTRRVQLVREGGTRRVQLVREGGTRRVQSLPSSAPAAPACARMAPAAAPASAAQSEQNGSSGGARSARCSPSACLSGGGGCWTHPHACWTHPHACWTHPGGRGCRRGRVRGNGFLFLPFPLLLPLL